MNDWQKHGTIRKHVIHKTMDNPFEVPDFKDQIEWFYPQGSMAIDPV